MARSTPKRILLCIFAIAVVLMIFRTRPIDAQFPEDEFVTDNENLHLKIEFNGRNIKDAIETDPIRIDLETPMHLSLQINTTAPAALNLSGSIWFYYNEYPLFPIEIRDPASNTSWVEIPENVTITPIEADIPFNEIVSPDVLGSIDTITGKFQASLTFTYYLLPDTTNPRTLEHVFFFLIPVDNPLDAITSVAGIATTVSTVGVVTGLGSGINSILEAIQTSHKIRSIHKKTSEIRSLPNLTVLGALPALFTMLAGMVSVGKKKEKGMKLKEGDGEPTAEAASEYRLRQRIREVAPDAWPMDKCPICKKKWDKKNNTCKKCHIDEEEARQRYADLLVSKVPRALKAFKTRKKALSIKKLAKKTKSNQYNAGVIGAAMVDIGITEITKVETPLKSFVMNIGGLAFLILTWQQLLGGSHSQFQTTLTVVGGALSLAVIIALYFSRKTQIEKLRIEMGEVEEPKPPPEETPEEPEYEEALEEEGEIEEEVQLEDKSLDEEPVSDEGEAEDEELAEETIDPGESEVEEDADETVEDEESESNSLTPEQLEKERK